MHARARVRHAREVNGRRERRMRQDASHYRQQSDAPKRKQGVVSHAINEWCNRLISVITQRSFSGPEVYEANCTSRDYVWNTIGSTVWGLVFPLLTIVVTQISGTERAGMFSMAFVTASLLMILANFGTRVFQVSDQEEVYSFNDYQFARVITCVAMIIAAALYCSIRGYDEEMLGICRGVILYKLCDGFADVYEGRLQQKGKLYLAGISQMFRSAVAFVVFCAALFVTQNLVIASMAMGIVAVASLVVLTIPLAILETPRCHGINIGSVISLFKQCWPLFVALFLYALIDNMPKFVMEGMLSYDNQLYFNAMYFPAQAVLIIGQLLYKPMVVKMSDVWADRSRRRRFDLLVLAVIAAIAVITGIVLLLMMWIGVDLLSLMYGVDFAPYRSLCYLMIIAGGVTACIDFLYQTITVLRRQKDVTTVYLITVIFAVAMPVLLIHYAQLQGTVLSYLFVMSILFVLIVWVYLRIRISIQKEEKNADISD